MKNYVVLSHMPQEVMAAMPRKTPEEMQNGMKAWFDWKEKHSEQVVDMGAPLFGGVKVLAEGPNEPSTKDTAGYMIVTAENLESAIELLRESPLFENMEGCDIEVHEAMNMK